MVKVETGRQRFERAASDVYNAIGHDMGWTLETPDAETFVDVICDQIGNGCEYAELDAYELAVWRTLSRDEKRSIVLTAL